MLYVRFLLSRRNIEDLLHELGINGSDEKVRFWWNRFGPKFLALSRLGSGLSTHLCGLSFECQGAFAT